MKKIIKNIFLFFKGDSLLRRINNTPRVLFWHGVDDIIDDEVEEEIFDLEVFNKQIIYLNKYYEIISIDEFYNRFVNNSFTNKEIVLTFDDGYANNLYKVTPILNKLSLPFTVFISTEHINEGILFPTSIARLILKGANLNSVTVPSLKLFNIDISTNERKIEIHNIVSRAIKSYPLTEVKKITIELINNVTDYEFLMLNQKYKSLKPMNWGEVKELKKLGATIGSHCKYHICCHNNQDNIEIEKQVRESKKHIEENLGVECNYFAYPNGDYTESSNISVQKSGYRMGFTTEKKVISQKNSKLLIPRIGASRNFSTFKLSVNLYPIYFKSLINKSNKS